MSKFFYMAIGTVLAFTGLCTYLEMGNVYYEMAKRGDESSRDIVHEHFSKAKEGWKFVEKL